MAKSLFDFALDNNLQFSADAINHFFFNKKDKNSVFYDIFAFHNLGYTDSDKNSENAYHQASKYLYDLEFRILSCLDDERNVSDEEELVKLMSPMEELISKELKMEKEPKEKIVKEETEWRYWEVEDGGGEISYTRTAVHQTTPHGAKEISKEVYDRGTSESNREKLQREWDELHDKIEDLNDELDVASDSEINPILDKIKRYTNEMNEIEDKIDKS